MRFAIWVGFTCLAASPALAEDDRPMQLEFGFNTRHFNADTDAKVAFRGTGEMDPSLDASSAVSSSIRFTGAAFDSAFFGVEGEAGALVGHAGSNLAGAYGVGGGRGVVGPVRLSAELVAGRRWIRYSLMGGRTDPAKWIAEPRVRADVWLGSRVTLGGAIGATLDDRMVWIAGLYVGLHSNDYDRRILE